MDEEETTTIDVPTQELLQLVANIIMMFRSSDALGRALHPPETED